MLIQPISKEEIYRHWEKNLQAELALPFTPQSHQYALYLLDQCNPKKVKSLTKIIWNRFYKPLSQ